MLTKQVSSPIIDNNALFKIGYGLYVITSNDGKKDNGLIVNTICQITSSPLTIMVTINKECYSCSSILSKGIMNVNILTSDTPFSVFKRFGYQSGRDVDKFIDYLDTYRSSNGLLVLSNYINAYLSLVVEHSYDMGTHMMFICSVSESKLICNKESITYDYYQKNVKPKPVSQKKGWVCKVCGYVYEGEELPSDYICPICKHPYSDFIKNI